MPASHGGTIGCGQPLAELVRAPRHHGVFGDRPHHFDDPGFLESRLARFCSAISADFALIDLASEVKRRDGIKIRAGDASNQVGCTRPRGGHGDAGLSVDPPADVGGHRRRLLMEIAGIRHTGLPGDGIDHERAGAAGEDGDLVAAHLREKSGDVLGAGHARGARASMWGGFLQKL